MAETTGKSHGLSGFIIDTIRETFITHGLPWLTQLGKDKVKERAEEAPRRQRNRYYFTDAMTRLWSKNPKAFKVVKDFLENHLTTDEDREDFQVGTARLGGEEENHMQMTVDFLELLATNPLLPDHDAREVYLVALRVLQREESFEEQAKRVFERITNTVVPGWDAVKDQVATNLLPIDASIQQGADDTITTIDNARTRLRGLRRRLRR